MLLQGTVLGAAGGAVGLVCGVALSFAVRAAIDEGSATQFWGVHIPWIALAGVLVFSVCVGTIAAMLPARTVSRGDTIQALRGARRPQRASTAHPLIGSLLVIGGAALTIVCSITVAALSTRTAIPWDSPLRALPIWGIVIGPIAAQIGILVSGRWLLWVTSRLLGGVSLAARIATRDAAANATRTVPAFAAVAATVFLGVFAAGSTTMQAQATARQWAYSAPVGDVGIGVSEPQTRNGTNAGPPSPDDLDAGLAAAETLARDAGATSTARVTWGTPSAIYLADGMAPVTGATWTELQTPEETSPRQSLVPQPTAPRRCETVLCA